MIPATPDNDAIPGDVLVVEDDPLIALDFEDTLRGFGVSFIRTASGAARALEMIAQHPPQFALLDIGLRDETSFSVADRLAGLKIPFAFVTGYSVTDPIPAEFADRPRLPKPFAAKALAALLRSRR